MFHVCVICMVDVKRIPLVEMTKERRQLWERIISPHICISNIKKSLLLVCNDCCQLLDAMLKFRNTMDVGVMHLISLIRSVKPQAPNRVLNHELPAVIEAQSDLFLPVANEEVVRSMENWLKGDSSKPRGTKSKNIKRPAILRHPPIKQKVLRVSDHNTEFAVLIPINEDTPAVNLLCEATVQNSPQISETSKIEEVADIPDEFAIDASDWSEEKNTELDRQLTEVIELLQSPFDITYEPGSGLVLPHKAGLEIEPKLGLELESKSEIQVEPNTVECEPKSEHEFKCKWGLDSERESLLKSDSIPNLECEVQGDSLELQSKSKPVLESKSESELKRKLGLESERELVLKLKHDLGLDLEHMSGPGLEPKWRLQPECDLVRQLKRDLGLNLEENSGLELERKSGLKLDRKSGPEVERKSDVELERKSEPEVERKSGLDCEQKSGIDLKQTSRFELERKSDLELKRKSGLDLKLTSGLELERKSELELERKSELELGRKSGLELKQTSGLDLKQTSGLDLKRTPGLELERKSGLELEQKSELEFDHKSVVDFDRASCADSESTLSCKSDYEDPEIFPNIIFAQAFNVENEDLAQIKETQGEKEDVKIHSHIVSNPPSEWPCTWERCQLHEDEHEDEDGDPGTPTEVPRGIILVKSRSNTTEHVPGRPKCKLCGKDFAKIYTLWQHYEREHMGPSHRCDECRKECRNETELKLHKIKHQFKSSALPEGALPRFSCAACGVLCRGARHLRLHLATPRHAARTLWRYQCDVCERKFPDKVQIAEHIQKWHLWKEAVKCSQCSASFKSARALQRHAAAHIAAAQQTAQANKQTRKRARNKQTDGVTDALRNGIGMQKNGQAKKARKLESEVKTLNRQDIQTEVQDIHTNIQETKRPRKDYTRVKAYRNSLDTRKQGDIHADTQENQACKKPRKMSKGKPFIYRQDKITERYVNIQDKHTDMHNQPRRRKTQAEVKAHKQESIRTEIYLNEHDYFYKERKGQRKHTTHTKTFSNTQDTDSIKRDTHTVQTPMYTQENTHSRTHEMSAGYRPPESATTSEPHTNTYKPRKTHTLNARKNKQTVENTPSGTQTNGVRKRRKRRPYTVRKRKGTSATPESGKPKPKASLFDMISSFIL